MTAPATVYGGGPTYGDGTYGMLAPGRHSVVSAGVRWDPAAMADADVLPAVRIAISRGRGSERLSIEQGRCVVEISDPDRIYDPSNGASPIAANLKVMRPLTVEMAVDSGGTATAIFTGVVSRITHDPAVGAKRTVIEAVDGFERLATVYPVIAATGATLTGTVIGLVHDAAGITNRDLNGGDPMPTTSADGSSTGLAIIQDIVAVDRGTVFVKASGTHAYRDRSYYHAIRTAVATITAAIAEAFLPARDVLNVLNQQTVTATPGGTPQTAINTTSQASYGVRQGGGISSPYLLGNAQAASLASYLVTTRGEPEAATKALALPGMTVAQLEQMRDRDVADLVTLSGIGGGGDAWIEGIEHEITRAQHKTTWSVSPKSYTAFTIGVSTIQGAHTIAY